MGSAGLARLYDFVTVDVFTDRRFGGNPLAVFPAADGVTGAEMQAIAGEFNLSETAFVLPPAEPAHTAAVRIFTPRTELPFAGHPNVGTGWVLAQRGLDRDGVLLFEEAAGLVRVEVERGAAGILATRIGAPAPLTTAPAPPAAVVAACAGLAADDLVRPPVLASVGTEFLFAEVAAAALSHAAGEISAFRGMVASHAGLRDTCSLYLYARDRGKISARMFGPLAGIPEDPATGSAAATLAALLLDQDGGDALAIEISQGVEMGRPSRLLASARRDADGVRAWVGGSTVPVTEGRLTL